MTIEGDREKIKELLVQAQMLWDDTRPSQDMGPLLGLGMMMVHSTPESIQHSHRSSEKAAIMQIMIDAAGLLPGTKAFREYLSHGLSVQYDFGLPASYVFPIMGINLESNSLGSFEPNETLENERVLLDTEIRSATTMMLAHHMVIIRDEEAAQMPLSKLVTALSVLFTDRSTRQLVEPSIVRGVESGRIGGIDLFDLRLAHIQRTVEWVDQYHPLYKDDRFVEPASILRPILRYLDPSPQPPIP